MFSRPLSRWARRTPWWSSATCATRSRRTSGEIGSDALTAVQEEQLGTGHAVRMALKAAHLPGEGTVVVLPGDAPLITTASLQRLLDSHVRHGGRSDLADERASDPFGYGRIVRGSDGAVKAIVEERDADDATRAIREVGTSVYAFDGARLRAALARVTTDNAQGEEYLTDVIGLLVADGEIVSGSPRPRSRRSASMTASSSPPYVERCATGSSRTGCARA